MTDTSATCPNLSTAGPFPTPPAPALSPVLPLQVPPHTTDTPLQARAFFDTFSWQSFVALNWPALIGPDGLPVRGVPNPVASLTTSGPRVWESYKADWETFLPGGAQPSPWQSYDFPNPCTAPTDGRYRKLMPMATKMDSFIDGVNEAFSSPLIAQYPAGTPPSSQYARYEVRLNQTEYTQILNNGWYLAKNLPALVDFPSTPAAGVPGAPYGAIEIKAAWKEILDPSEASNYYTTVATVVEPTKACRDNVLLGLVGLHIAHKVTPFREWVWSTFEHVANVPDPHYPNITDYSFNNGTGNPPPNANGYDYKPPKANEGVPLPGGPPVQVNRVTPIPSTPAGMSTQDINDAWQKVLPAPWNNYQLVATQWPTTLAQFQPTGTYPAACDCPFPPDPVANAVQETYFQSVPTDPKQTHSCMSCHFGAAATDFSWVLSLHAYPSKAGPGDAVSSVAQRRLAAIERLREVVNRE